jgi:hypothetical protein
VLITCDATGKTAETTSAKDGSPKLPRGWKKIGGQTYSPEAKKSLYCPRSIRVPVASVVEGYDPPDWSVERCRLGWRSFRPAVKEASRTAAQIGNAMLFELARLDSLPLEDGEKGKKLPKWPLATKDLWKRLYTVGREQFPEFDSQSLAAIRQQAWRRYNDRKHGRFQIRVLGTVSLPTFRDGIPVPLPAKDCRIWFGDSKKPFLRFRLGGQRFTLDVPQLDRAPLAIEQGLILGHDGQGLAVHAPYDAASSALKLDNSWQCRLLGLLTLFSSCLWLELPNRDNAPRHQQNRSDDFQLLHQHGFHPPVDKCRDLCGN